MDKYIYKNEKEDEETDMCTAIRELIAEGRKEGIFNNMVENIKSLMTNLHLTVIEAMDALDIPEKFRPTIMEKIDRE